MSKPISVLSTLFLILAGWNIAAHGSEPLTHTRTIYGQIHLALISQNDKDLDINNEGHRIGVKGEAELDPMKKVFYKLETEYKNDLKVNPTTDTPSGNSSTDDADLVVRYAHIGLDTKLGTVTMGRQDNPINRTYKADIFQRNSGQFQMGKWRIGDALSYSKSYDSASLFITTIVDGTENPNDDQNDIDAYMAGGGMKFGDFRIDAGYMLVDYDDGDEQTSDVAVGFSYSKNNLYVGLQIESATTTDAANSDTDSDIIDLAIKYALNTTTVTFGYGQRTNSTNNSDDVDLSRWVIESLYSIHAQFYTYAGYSDFNKDAGDGDNFYLGMKLTF